MTDNTFGMTAGEFSAIKIAALRLALIILREPDETRQARVTAEMETTLELGPQFICGLNGYLLWNFAQSLENGYGGTAQAIDEVTAVLAAVPEEEQAT